MRGRSHPQDKEIYKKLREIKKMLRLETYMPNTANVLTNIEEEEEIALTYHNEKIANAFMLSGTLLRNQS